MTLNMRISLVIFGIVAFAIIPSIFIVHYGRKAVKRVNEVQTVSQEAAAKSVMPVNINAEFDIEHMNVFSVERDKDGKTVIGYINGSEQHEWYMMVTDAQHELFVQRFKRKLGTP